MNFLSNLTTHTYRIILKPVLFRFDPESVHNFFTKTGERLGQFKASRNFLHTVYSFDNPAMSQDIAGVRFANPIGLAAGFDYDGHLAETMSCLGFGFNTVGTVTAFSYEGNPKPRLARLPKSKSLLVNKGFKSEGAEAILRRLQNKKFDDATLGLSVGSTNSAKIKTIEEAIADYCYTFEKFKTQPFVKYFELNISCPNTSLTENFLNPKNFNSLLEAIDKLGVSQPIFVKMPNEINDELLVQLMASGLEHKICGYIFSNLVKNRSNPGFDQQEIASVSGLRGNFSGRPTGLQADHNIKVAYKHFGGRAVLIGCGGVFTAEDAYRRIRSGANLIQMITGMVYHGPQVIGQINRGLFHFLQRDGFSNISQAVGVDNFV